MAKAKTRTVYACQQCGSQQPKWMGKCPECGSWGTLAEEIVSPAAPAPGAMAKGLLRLAAPAEAVAIGQIEGDSSERLETGILELDRVLGGGIVPGSAVLVGGAPGIGKSTLLLQAAGCLAARGQRVLYVSAEESAKQVKMRADRLEIKGDNIFILPETLLESVLVSIDKIRPGLIIVDSLQTVYDPGMESAPGTVSQVREVAGRLTAFAKGSGTAVFLVGHVTKEGSIAGPRVVEHLVDTVLYFEESSGHPYRMLRAVKNRFGSTNELGIFQMNDRGLSEVANPSELFLAERPVGASGSVVAAAVEGTRPLLVEVQALVSRAGYGGTPRRTALGVDPNRAALLIAILEKKAGIPLAELDVYLNVAGGVKLREPASDLPAAVAIASSVFDRAIAERTVLFGELGLAGEVRAVTQAETRVKEAAKLGFERVVMPCASTKALTVPPGIRVIGVKTLEEAIQAAQG